MHWLTKFLLVALGGALGASSRTGLASLVASSFQGGAIAPAAIGTLAVNLVGCLGMGFGRAAAAASGWGTPEMQALVFSGFLGAFTTFSTFEADLHGLVESGDYLAPLVYLTVSVVGGFAVFVAGWEVASTALGR